MFQDSATTQANYERFISRIKSTGKVWGIQHQNDNWATSLSNELEDITIYMFWSDEAYAKRHCIEGWSNSRPASIELDSFIDNWLRGMHEDNCLVGPNWDAHFFGKEIEPIELAKSLTNS